MVTKIYAYHTFYWEPFKKDFIIMNEVPIQNDKNDIKKYYKLLNNSNFACNCRTTINNCSFDSICDEIEKLSYEPKYSNLFEPVTHHFSVYKLSSFGRYNREGLLKDHGENRQP